MRFIIAKTVDVPTYVEYGAADIGIIGKDVLLEQDKDVVELLVGALQRTGDANIDRDVVQSFGQQVSLAQTALAQRRVLLTLVAAFYIPGCFTMSD